MNPSIQRRPVLGDVIDPNLHPAIDRIYRARNIQSSAELENAARGLLHFKDLKGIDTACALLVSAIKDHKKITIVGDFDADGATSTALCILALRAMGVTQLDYLVPNRFDFGYGLSPKIVELAHQQSTEVIVTVDSGIACFDGVQRAKELGLDVIVTDHHLPGETLPEADAIVNPNQADCHFSSKNLAGVGVAFYLMSALKAALQSDEWFSTHNITAPNMADFLDIVAVGTVADVVPLDKNNRILVHQGLQRIKAGKCRPGISAIMAIANRTATYLTASDLGFVIGPRLNAAGRLEDMALGIECLLSDDVYQSRELAAKLDDLNQSRKKIEIEMREDAEVIVERLVAETSAVPSGLTVYDSSFHQGVIGIVSGRLREKFNRPTVTFARQDDDTLKGSGRSIPGVHIRDVFETIDKAYPNVIDKFGGHAMAAGLSIHSSQLSVFTKAFNDTLSEIFKGIEPQSTLMTDGELSAHDYTLDFALALKQAGPFGQGFEAPAFDNRFNLVSQRIVGEQHLKLVLALDGGQPIEAIAFNVDTQQWPNDSVQQVHAVYSPDINVFRNNTSLQLMVHHIEPC
ncbi:single-stranded-DNA-specific exonuclease RecJ [Alteromonas sp. 5E99-2]|uniref:single-stranded-DNA-specific exonuclease RecJ n=1 Tax=Alteromonas sp. 5E99-2 TaxID=2817683 RepID=UPI001A99A8B7|nr:single-stranded-DNA-specific exonuclease RecJ [Alteromonas sp. 5E99-2]